MVHRKQHCLKVHCNLFHTGRAELGWYPLAKIRTKIRQPSLKWSSLSVRLNCDWEFMYLCIGSMKIREPLYQQRKALLLQKKLHRRGETLLHWLQILNMISLRQKLYFHISENEANFINLTDHDRMLYMTVFT